MKEIQEIIISRHLDMNSFRNSNLAEWVACPLLFPLVNSLIVHGPEHFLTGLVPSQSLLVSVFAFSHPVHWVSLVTGHSPSMQTPEPEQNPRLSLVHGSSLWPLIGPWLPSPADRSGSHDAQSSVWKSGLFIAATHLATSVHLLPVTPGYTHRDEMWCQPLHLSNLFLLIWRTFIHLKFIHRKL